MYFIPVIVISLIGLTKAQIISQTCVCVGRNHCFQNSSGGTTGNDGSGLIDIRIVNPGDPVTLSPVPIPTTSPGVCPLGYDLCCTGAGVVGCGLRYFIPATALTTPGPGQMPYGSQPWQVLLFDTANNYIGGGALLDSMNVLTVAHKVINRTAGTIKARLGDWDVSRVIENYPQQEAIVAQIRIHPSYINSSTPNLQNDVALLRLSSPIIINTATNPAINSICLPSATMVFDGMRCLVAGWGKDSFTGNYQNIPKQVEVPVIPYTDCQTRLRATARLGPNFNLDANSFLCAGGEPGRDACTGDGGAALACIVSGRYQLAGMVSWGIGCADSNVPGVYVKVQNFLVWIQTQMST